MIDQKAQRKNEATRQQPALFSPGSLWPNFLCIGIFRFLSCAFLSWLLPSATQAQTGVPPSASDPLTGLVLVAERLVPQLQQVIESPLLAGLENLAFWMAVIVMMISFARLFRENDGGGKELFWWCCRLGIIFSLFGTGRTIINTAGQIGYDIVNVTEFRRVLWEAELDFNTNYQKFTEGMFLVKPTAGSPDELIGALTSENPNYRDITKLLDISSWNLSSIFIGVTLTRFLLEFASLFLALSGALLMIGLRLFAPFAIALAIDRSLAQRITWPFAWSAGVFTMVTPLVSHILGLMVYTAGNLAFQIIRPETALFSLDASGQITGDPERITQAVYACLILMVLMALGSLLLLASPYISYKLAFGQIFEAVSTTASGWLGAFAATGMEIAGVKYGSALQRQAAETRLEGQYQAETQRATAARDAGNLSSRAQQMLGLQSAAASRTQALGSIAGGYAMSVQMAEAQRTASLGLIEQSRRQQVAGMEAERSFGQQQTVVAARREEGDLRLNQGERNVRTLVDRTLGVPESLGGVLATDGHSAASVVTGPMRGYGDISVNNSTTEARVLNLRTARRDQVENYEYTAQKRMDAAQDYAREAAGITEKQTAATKTAARVQRDLAAGGVERGYAQQVAGVTSAYKLNLEANQTSFAGALKAAEVMQRSGLKAVKLEQMAQIITTLSRDFARRAEQAATMRF